jgi:alpha-tubulin suppressor-like RCC1 family protein
LSKGDLYAFGSNSNQQLGQLQTVSYNPLPTKVLTEHKIISMAANGGESYILRSGETRYVRIQNINK